MRAKVPAVRCAFLVIALWAGAAGAAEPERGFDPAVEAAKYRRAGLKAASTGHFREALRALQRAYELAPSPLFLRDLGAIRAGLYDLDKNPGHLKAGIEVLRQYLREVPTASDRAAVEEDIRGYEGFLRRHGAVDPAVPEQARTTELMVTSPTAGARIWIDIRIPDKAFPSPLIQTVTPGRHRVFVEADGHRPFERLVQVEAGRLVVIEAALEIQPASLEVETDELGVQVWIDGQPQGETPLTGPILLPPGRYRIFLTKRGRRRWEGEVNLRAGQKDALFMSLETTRQRWVSWSLLGTSLALAGTATYTGLQKESRESDAERLVQDGFLSTAAVAQYNTMVEDTRRSALLTNVFAGTASAAFIAAAILFWFDEGDAPREEGFHPVAPRLPVRVSAGPGGVLVEGRF